MIPYIIILLIVLSLILFWVIYNRLVLARETVEEALAGIDVQLKKRFELIPSLVEIVKGYSTFEEKTLTKVTALRSKESSNIVQTEKKDAGLNLVSRSLRLTVEDYPELKANTSFLKLMKELSTVEDELAMSRRYLNGTIRDYNTKIEIFPNVIFSGWLGFKERSFYEIEPFEREPHKIFE
ncbi:LemA family protein [Brumimicrobium aurantiacum]|uniref:LemA family protein n=1 Tax=Brumimicrobium aurantiacum TaxID=1737063 RepID=A0A3E1EWS3_9FLAO|nr:LemA family protein [Brumimicrobium aurantiacum]RFC54006.1 LemA family protein [Brumimicrobium aurantiacum]